MHPFFCFLLRSLILLLPAVTLAQSPLTEFTVTAAVAGGQGAIGPASQKVAAGDDATFFVVADPGWRVTAVTADNCTPVDQGAGVWTAAAINADCQVLAEFVEQASAELRVCSEPMLPIPDGDLAGINDSIEIDADGEIVEVRVELVGTHTWVGDLVFTLIHPDQATGVVLIDRPGVPATTFGCDGENFDLLLSDDGLDGPVDAQCSEAPPALFGNPVPEQPLAEFSGLNLNGLWTLNAADVLPDFGGTLESWCLEATYLPPANYIVTPSAGSGGAIIPAIPQSVLEGQVVSFEVRPDEGFGIDQVGGSCGGSLVGEDYTTDPVVADCTVEASFAVLTYQVTAAVGTGEGIVAPSSQTVEHGASASVTITPELGWRIDDVRGDTCTPEESGPGEYQADSITQNCLITVDFDQISYVVTPSTQGGGGSIAPDDPQTVLEGQTASFTLVPSEDFVVDEVAGSCGGTLDGKLYTTDPVSADCEVLARFRFAPTFTVTPSVSGSGGAIEPASPQQVESGESISFGIFPEPGFEIDQVGGSCGGSLDETSYLTDPIIGDCSVTASFRALDDFLFDDRFESAP
ncbi:MAG: hypothetical protein EA370_14385 [Wenzhouxiangella sp.]|nr:MAG: hypothetical protein EA370_14385 [Wenzhouxiangella sp.]